MKNPLTVAWISDFPIEWLPDLPEPLLGLPRPHPTTWQRTLLAEFKNHSELRLHLVSLRKSVTESTSFEREGVTFHVLKTAPLLRLGSLFWLDTLLIKRLLRTIKPDLVHAWGSEKGAAWVANRLGYPYLATVQGLLDWYREVVPLAYSERLLAGLERRSFPLAPVITTESAFAVRFLKERYPKLKALQIEHAPNRVFHSVERRPATNPIHFIFIGSWGFRKGTDLLLRALDQLKSEFPFHLTVISERTPASTASESPHISRELWKRIEFKQRLSPQEIAREFQSATMMLFPTRADVSPNAVKEALVAGIPVIASRIGGIPDYLKPGKNGFLFESDNLNDFVNAIRNAVRHSDFSRGLIDAQSLAQTRDYLSPERMARGFLKAYEQALSHPANRNRHRT